MSHRTFARAATSLAALSLVFAASPANAQEPERHLLHGDRITIWNLVGRATIEATTGNAVVVEVTRGGSDRRDIRIRAEDGQFSVMYPDRTIVYREGPGTFDTRLTVYREGRFTDEGGAFPVRIRSTGGGLDAHADLRILVPRGKVVTVNIAVGMIDASNVNGDLTLRSRFSRIHVLSHAGDLTANSGAGRIQIEGATGDVRAATGSGSIELADIKSAILRASTGSGRITGRRIETERLEASSGSGGITLDVVTARNVRSTSGSGSVRLDLRQVPRDLTSRSGSGSVEVSLPSEVNAEIDITTGSGGISSEFPVTMESVRRRELRGRIGTGADGFLRVSTGSGSVRILQR